MLKGHPPNAMTTPVVMLAFHRKMKTKLLLFMGIRIAICHLKASKR
jgi:hypothetical protein